MEDSPDHGALCRRYRLTELNTLQENRNTMLKRTTTVDEALYDNLLSASLHETDVMRRLREETSHMPMGGMQIAADQGSFMALLVNLIGAKKTLEVGVFT